MRKVFFSFEWRDAWRAFRVRNSGVIEGCQKAGFKDEAEVEEVKKKTKNEIENWIDEQLNGTSVTCVLIGRSTSESKYVKYEINESIARGNGILGIFIHNMRDQKGNIDPKGSNPLPYNYSTYNWEGNAGYRNLGNWIEKAAREAGK